ncbi:MAG: glutathione S-transferase family protein [Myxococcota bacterium]
MRVPSERVTTEEVKSWSGLHLLHFQSSTCSQKVRILLREKGLAWTSHPVDLPRNAHVTPWFLGINARGVVPVLVHDGAVHVESNDILAHLDALPSNAPPFFPKDPAALADVNAELAREDAMHMDLRNLTMGFLMPHALAKKPEQTLQRWEVEGRKDPRRAKEVAWWRDYARQGIPDDVAQASVERHREVFADLDGRLATAPFLGGETPSVLDLTWFITALRLSKAGYPLTRHPRLAEWFARVSARPAFAEESCDPLALRLALPVYGLYRKLTRTTLTDRTR